MVEVVVALLLGAGVVVVEEAVEELQLQEGVVGEVLDHHQEEVGVGALQNLLLKAFLAHQCLHLADQES